MGRLKGVPNKTHKVLECGHTGKAYQARGLCGTCYQRVRRVEPDYKSGHSDRNWKSRIRRMFGITPNRYFEMLSEQNELCKICKKPVNNKRLAVDHCHETGKVRGLLCSKCNAFLGWYEKYHEETKEYLDNPIDYRDL